LKLDDKWWLYRTESGKVKLLQETQPEDSIVTYPASRTGSASMTDGTGMESGMEEVDHNHPDVINAFSTLYSQEENEEEEEEIQKKDSLLGGLVTVLVVMVVLMGTLVYKARKSI